MFNDPLFNEGLFNDSGGAAPVVPGVIVDTPDPGVSFTISDELGPEGELEDSNGGIC